jgi:hypothetical protein
VSEGLLQGAQLALHHHVSGLDVYLHSLGDLQFLFG